MLDAAGDPLPGPRLRLAQCVLVGYATIICITAAVRAGTAPGNWGIAVGHALIILLIWLVSDPGVERYWVRVLRELLPLLLLPALYASLDVLNSGGRPVHDTVILRWEEALFGGQPAREWWQRHPSLFWSALLHGIYLLYYPIVAVPALVLTARGDWPAVRVFVRSVVATFCFCYLIFVFFPVSGPYYQFARPHGPFANTATAQLVYRSLAGGSSYGAAFPSSHVAASLAAGYAAWKGWPPLGWVVAVPVFLMPVAAVYCQMHYAVDVIAGLALGGMIPWLASKLEPAP